MAGSSIGSEPKPWRWPDRSTIGLAAAATWFVAILVIGDRGGLTTPSSRMLAIFGTAVALWVTEAIPLSATSILVIMTQILLISDEAIVGLSAGFEAPPYESFFATLAHPVLMLFLGGFFLAEGANKYSLDRTMARVLLRPFGSKPASVRLTRA